MVGPPPIGNNGPVTDVDSPLVLTDLFTQWQIDWVTLAVVVAVGVGYLRARLTAGRLGVQWPVRLDLFVALELLAGVDQLRVPAGPL